MTELRTAPTIAAREGTLGHVLGAFENGLVLVAIHLWPAWEVLPVLTDDTPRVLGIVDASLLAGIAVHLVLLARVPGWLTPAGLVVTSAFGVATCAWVYRVFPFDLTGGWETVARVLLLVGVVGSAIGVVAALVSMVRLLTVRRRM